MTVVLPSVLSLALRNFMIQTIEQLLLLMGLTLAQSMPSPEPMISNSVPSLTPSATIEVHGQRHILAFPKLSKVDAIGSIKAALALHSRDIDAYAVLEPLVAGQDNVDVLLVAAGQLSHPAMIRAHVDVLLVNESLKVTIRELELNGARVSSAFGEEMIEHFELGLSQVFEQQAFELNLLFHSESI